MPIRKSILTIFATRTAKRHLTARFGKPNDGRVKWKNICRRKTVQASCILNLSVIQLLSGGDNVAVSGLRKTEGLDDATLGRVELGGRYGFSERWSAYGWTNYTFGSDYEALSFGAGFSYAW